MPGASANSQESRCQARPSCSLAAERHDFHCPKAVRHGCLLVAASVNPQKCQEADGRPADMPCVADEAPSDARRL